MEKKEKKSKKEISKAIIKQITLERIKQLFTQAEKVFKRSPTLSNRYVQLAKRISMRTNVRIPREYKRRFCKHCYAYLKPGINCRVRTAKGRVIYYCSNCKKYMRFVIRKKNAPS